MTVNDSKVKLNHNNEAAINKASSRNGGELLSLVVHFSHRLRYLSIHEHSLSCWIGWTTGWFRNGRTKNRELQDALEFYQATR